MRSTKASTILRAGILFTLLAAIASPVSADTAVFYRNLSQGSSGPDVLELQRVLNRDISTAVAVDGPGSAGQETSYFGARTREAVIRFQNLYRDDTLVPNGLFYGTGIVGPSTRTVLNRIYAAQTQVIPATTAYVPPDYSTSIAPPQSHPVLDATSSFPLVDESTNPNLRNVNRFFAQVERVGRSKGMTDANLSKVRNQVLVDLATTTNMRSRFLQQTQGRRASAESEDLFAIFAQIFFPKEALAQGTERIFGGNLWFTFPCTCTGDNWILLIQPLAPDYVALLTYIPIEQEYESYNLPFSAHMLGHYSTSASECEIYIPPSECIPMPSEGDISPSTGSSPSW